MEDDFDIEAYFEAQAKAKAPEAPPAQDIRSADGNGADLQAEKSESRRDKSGKDDRDRDRDRRDKDKDRDRDRKKRSRSREKRRKRSTSYDRKKRSRSRDRSRERKRSSSKGREEREKEKAKEKEREREIERKEREEREKQAELERERKRELDELEDLTRDQRTVFVSQLVMKSTEDDLRSLFTQLGKVNRVVMIRDKNTGRHKGSAYVEMADLESIPEVLQLNGAVPPWQKFPMLVKASEAEKNFLAKKEASVAAQNAASEKGLLKNEDTRLYIGNLHVNITETDLQQVLEPFGLIESVHIHRDEVGTSKGYAFVKYARSEDATNAMNRLAGLELAGKPIKVGFVTESTASTAASAASGNWKLDDDEGTGMAMNAQSRVMLMAKLGQAAGMSVPAAFVNPMAPGVLPGGGPMGAVGAATSAGPTPVPHIGGTPSTCIKIKNMFDPAEETEENWDMDIKEDVEEECRKHGMVRHSHVETQQPGGLVFVMFTEIPAAQKAAATLHGRWFASRMITVDFISQGEYLLKFPEARAA